MKRACVDCGTAISAKSTGRCRRCAMLRVNRSPEKRAQLSETMRFRRTDPAFQSARSKAVRRGVPDERWSEYQHLRNLYGAEEARRIILDDERTKIRRRFSQLTDRMRLKHERERREAY